MIVRLQRKLIGLFLGFTMLAITVLLLIMLGNVVLKEQKLEKTYAERAADSIMEQLGEGIVLTEAACSEYALKFQTWVCLSDGRSAQSGPECFSTPTADLMEQIDSGRNVTGMEAIFSNTVPDGSVSRTDYRLDGAGSEQFYGIQNRFCVRGTQYRLVVICPVSSLWSILRRSCGWYVLIWLIMLVLMYGMSRFLIQKAILPVEASMKSQKDFIAAASHELKSPLAVIQANAEAMEIEDSDLEKRQKQAVILEECDRMGHLIRSLLSLAASDAGNWNMKIQETDMDTLLIETWEAYQTPCRKKRIALKLDLKEDCYPKVPCDQERIGQVLGILLDNAVCYSFPGTSVELGAADRGTVFQFYVADHGPGVPDAAKERIFDRFYRADASRTDKSHYGLGLSIAKEIVELHHGRIELTDTPGGGCTFVVSLPARRRMT